MYYYVYIVTNKPRWTLYVWVTNNIHRRGIEHNLDTPDSFTWKYRLHHLVYYEGYTSIVDAIIREKQLKNRHRQWKINLIEQYNSQWNDIEI